MRRPPAGQAAATPRRSLHALSTLEQENRSFSPEAVRALPGPPWLVALRTAAWERFSASSLPTGAEEMWRYGRIGDLDLDRFFPAVPQRPGGLARLPSAAQALLDRMGERAGFVLVEDGRIREASLSEEGELAGARLGPLAEAPESFGRPFARFAAAGETDAVDDLAVAFTPEPVHLVVPPGVSLSRPIVVVNLVAPDGTDEVRGPAVFSRLSVVLGDSSSASVVEIAVSGRGAALYCPITELSLGDNCALSHTAVQQLGGRTWQLGRTFASAGRDARLKSFTASLGGEYARSRTDSSLDGVGGSAELLAAYLGDGSQVHDFRTLQEHTAARTTSDLVFKGAVGGSARSVYSGMIRMRRGAKGANAFQTNRNLVLSEGAHADSVPNLDIEENDVRCSHASAVGPIDTDHLFYLESRGIPAATAERLVLLGFFAELLERAEPATRDHVVSAVRARLGSITGGPPE